MQEIKTSKAISSLLQQCVIAQGEQATIILLTNFLKSERTNIFNSVKFEVCKILDISENQLDSSKSYGGKRSLALGMISFILFSEFGYDQARVSDLIKKHPSTTCKYIKAFFQLDKNNRQDQKIIRQYSQVINVLTDNQQE